MTPTKFLLGQVITVFAIVIGAVWLATQMAAADLGYCDRRSIYQIFYQLRDKGLAEMVKGDGHRLGKTTFVCFARPEDCLVIDKSKCKTRGIRKPRKKATATKRVVMSVPKLIPYVGQAVR